MGACEGGEGERVACGRRKEMDDRVTPGQSDEEGEGDEAELATREPEEAEKNSRPRR